MIVLIILFITLTLYFVGFTESGEIKQLFQNNKNNIDVDAKSIPLSIDLLINAIDVEKVESADFIKNNFALYSETKFSADFLKVCYGNDSFVIGAQKEVYNVYKELSIQSYNLLEELYRLDNDTALIYFRRLSLAIITLAIANYYALALTKNELEVKEKIELDIRMPYYKNEDFDIKNAESINIKDNEIENNIILFFENVTEDNFQNVCSQ